MDERTNIRGRMDSLFEPAQNNFCVAPHFSFEVTQISCEAPRILPSSIKENGRMDEWTNIRPFVH